MINSNFSEDDSGTQGTLCFDCKHFHVYPDKSGVAMTCDAFPDGIPIEIVSGEVSHLEPFPGDNNIQFEERE